VKIVALTVTDEHGVEHHWEGVEGHVHVRSNSYKKDNYVQTVSAHLVLPTEGKIGA
jgi:hypothetical protein